MTMKIKNSVEAMRAQKETLRSMENMKAFLGCDIFTNVVKMTKSSQELAEFIEAMHVMRVESDKAYQFAFMTALVVVNNALVDDRIDSETARSITDKVIAWWRYYE